MRIKNCHALITGASSGIGREFAKQLAARASLLVLVARREERLEELRDELKAAHPQLRVEVRPTDLAETAQIASLLDWIAAEKFPLDLLVNNAGLGDLGSFANAELEKLDRMMLVNMVALTRLTRSLLPAMITRKRGAVLNVSSSASFLPMANFAVYAATKAYVTSFSEALRSELRGTGVSVTALCPGPVQTEFTEVAHREAGDDADFAPAIVYVRVEEVVRAALRGLERDRAIVIPGWAMKAGMALVRLTPMPLLRFASRFSAKRA
ncbi:MAG TPA: SDR family NAD(P)-dependent oxidoreductase [Chthoniobacterales bacterium]|jgi:hypothetical protein|nr:SDR family NAD(P)-dependent oxidoreductase [Chthoniobacterales bacterium]